jgi:hypothetical protein
MLVFMLFGISIGALTGIEKQRRRNKPIGGVQISTAVGAAGGAVAEYCIAHILPNRQPIDALFLFYLYPFLYLCILNGVLLGLFCGFVARRVKSVMISITVGGGMGLLLAFLWTLLPLQEPDLDRLIMLSGFVFGALTGLLTQHSRFGSILRPAARAAGGAVE